MTGEWPKESIDHIDLSGINNRFENLREATSQQNSRNIAARSKCGLKGVTWFAKQKKWRAAICVSDRRIWLGDFEKMEDAHKAYCEAASAIHGEFFRAA